MEDKEIIEEISSEIGDIWSQLGFNPAMGKIWGILYLKGNMTQSEIKEELGLSLSTVSQSLSALEKLGPVKKASCRFRKHTYAAEKSMRKITKKKIETMLRFYINPMCDFLSSREKEAKGKELKERISSMKKKYSGMGTFMKIISKVNI